MGGIENVHLLGIAHTLLISTLYLLYVSAMGCVIDATTRETEACDGEAPA